MVDQAVDSPHGLKILSRRRVVCIYCAYTDLQGEEPMTLVSQNEQPEAKRRGTGFPSMPLQDAVDAVVLAGRNGPEHSHDAFATYLGHKTANSGAFRGKLASMRDWGLLGRGGRDRVTLSGLAQELVMAAPDYTRQQLLTAFESCRVFGVLYNDSAKNVPIEFTRLRTQVLMKYGVGKDQADKFVSSFVQSAVFAGLAQSDGTAVTLFQRESAFANEAGGHEVDDASEEVPSSNAASRSSSMGSLETPVAAQSGVPVALRQQWPIDGGEIEFVIRTAAALPPSVYALVAEMAEVAEKMKSKLSGPAFEITSETPPAAYRTTAPQAD